MNGTDIKMAELELLIDDLENQLEGVRQDYRKLEVQKYTVEIDRLRRVITDSHKTVVG